MALFNTKPTLVGALEGQQVTLRTSGQTAPARVVSVDGKKVKLELTKPATGDAILKCPHPEQGVITARGTVDKKGVLTVKEVESSEQRRGAYRVRAAVDVKLVMPGGHEIECKTTDVSVGGVRLASCFRLRVDDTVRAHVTLDEETVFVKATVARAEANGGCGLRFVGLTPEEDQKLGQFVAERQRGSLSVVGR